MATPELLLNAELSAAERRRVQRLAQAGELNRIRPGVFTPLPKEEWPALIARHRPRVLNALFPDAVIGFRSALAGGMPVDGRIYLNYTYAKLASLPGLEVVLVNGPGRVEGDMPVASRLFIAGEVRQLLENLVPNRGRDERAAGVAAVEDRIVQICQSRGEAALNDVRDKARELAPELGRERECARLETMIGSILGSRPAHKPATAAAAALARSVDHHRIELFDVLVSALNETEPPAVVDVAASGPARVHAALFESYFGNYIEGTKFSIAEATQIVLEGKPAEHRPKDSKDIEGVFRHANEPAWRVQTLGAGKPVLEQLRVRHADMMRARPEVRPGEFKTEVNYAGNTEFVHPRNVTATLVEGSSRLVQVRAGFPRAMLAHFLVAEVHPFADGNGRLARLVMNAELSAVGLNRIIIPTIACEDYLGTLRLFTREQSPQPLLRFLASMQRWTAAFQYSELEALTSSMKACNAFEEDASNYRLGWPTAPR